MKHTVALGAVFFSLFLWSCGGDSGCISGPLCDDDGGGGAGGSVVVATVGVTSPTTSFASLGATAQLRATASSSIGAVISSVTFSWATSDQSVVSVAASGLATAAGNGTATITATADGTTGQGVNGSVILTVSQVGTSLVLSDSTLTFALLADTTQLSATVKDAGGATMASATVTWATSSSSVATVSSTGLVTSVADGTATITATSASASATASVTVGLPTVSGTIPITYNLHESLPTAWIEQFAAIMKKLAALLPLNTTNFNTVTVYSWNDNITDPYDGVDGGSYIGGSGDLLMVLEMPNAGFEHSSLHQYAVIAHEYFHLRQLSINSSMATNAFNIKWLTEGSAAVFESVYTDQYYSPSDQTYFEAFTPVDFLADGDPTVLESYDSRDERVEDVNGSSSVFLVLALVKELMTSGYSEADAFKRVLETFPAQSPTDSNWKSVFESLFGFSVDDFYNVVKTSPDYRQVPVTAGVDVYKVRPTRSLTVQSIFD